MITNQNFTDLGQYPGEADNWTLFAMANAETIAGFGPAPFYGFEDFEKWFEFKSAFEDGETVLMLFDSIREALEDFEENWNNEHYLTEFSDGYLEAAIFSTGEIEDYETNWLNDDYLFNLVNSIAAVFNGNDHENFTPAEYFFEWDLVNTDIATFDGNNSPGDGFEGTWTEIDSF